MTGKKIASLLVTYMQSLFLFGGDHDEQLFEALPWESKIHSWRFLSGRRFSALSVARGNGKSRQLCWRSWPAAVVDPDGPLHGNRRDVDCFGSSVSSKVASSSAIFW